MINYYLVLFFFVFLTLIQCRSEECTGLKGFANTLPLVTNLTDCKRDTALLDLAILSGILQSGSSSASSCPGRLNPLDMSDANIISCSEASLKQAIESGGKIQLPSGCTITLTSQIIALRDFQLDGNGGMISGNNAHRIIALGSLNDFTTIGLNVTIQNITLRNGRTQFGSDPNSNVTNGDGSAIFITLRNNTQIINVNFIDNLAISTSEGGGAIRSRGEGKLTVSGSRFENNEANTGGAINNLLTDLTVIDSTFINNRAKSGSGGGGGSGPEAGSGGAIYTDGAGSDGTSASTSNGNLVICGSYFERNHGNKGGAYFSYIYGNRSTSTIHNSVFVENTAGITVTGEGQGGAIYHGSEFNGNRTNLFVENSSFTKNRVKEYGGAIATNTNPSVSITNSSFVENRAEGSGQNNGLGGSLFATTTTLDQVTIARNSTDGFGGAVAPQHSGASITINNSIVANNTATNAFGNAQNCSKLGIGSNSIEFPQVKNSSDPNDPNCYTGILISDPLLATTPTNCDQRIGHSGEYRIQVLNKLSGSPASSLGARCK